MPVKEIQFDKQTVVSCDERGRATLGSEYANEKVFVYVAELPNPDELVKPPQDEQRVLSQMHSWARKQEITVMDYHPEDGTVEDENGEIHQTPFSTEEQQ